MALSFIGLIFNDKSYFNYFRCAQFYQFETSNMNKLFTQVLLAGFFLSAGSAFGQVIISKDGKVLGDQKEIVKSCVEAAAELNQTQLRPFFVKTCVNGIFMDEGVEDFISKEQAFQICNCALDKLIEKGYTYGQITALSDTGSPEFEAVVLGCIPKELIEELNEE